MINASRHTIEAVGAAIGRARLLDNRIGDGDTARLAAWAESLEPYGFTAPQLLHAVAVHYNTEKATVIMPGDMIKHAREFRRDTAEREKAAEARAAIESGLPATPPALECGGLGINADGPPVPGAYLVNDAVERDCPHCKAELYEPCTNPASGRPRRMPCLARMRGLRAGAA